jgi:hypothetical protein
VFSSILVRAAETTLDIADLVDYSNRNSLGSRLRRRRGRLLRQVIDRIFLRNGSVRIIDLGGNRTYWRIFDEEYLNQRCIHITVVNIGDTQVEQTQNLNFSSITADACQLNFLADREFDLVHSNSTIEHVGDWDRVEAFARETRRLATNHFVQTPYYWFPIEPHVLMPAFHWLPEGLRAKMFVHNLVPRAGASPDLGHGMRQVLSARLLDKSQMKYLFPSSRVFFEWFGPFPKSMVAIRESES